MKKIFFVLLLLPLLTACPKRSAQELRIFNYSEYMPESVIKTFEKAENVRIVLDTYDDPDAMQAKLLAGADSEYDLVIVSDYQIPDMIRKGLLLKIRRNEVPNLANLDPSFANPPFDPGGVHSVVYQWGTTGIGYRKDKVNTPVTGWDSLFDPKRQDTNFLLLVEMREQMGAALKFLGKSVNSTDPADLAKVEEILIQAKKRSKGLSGGTENTQALLAGNVGMAVVYSGDIIQAMDEDDRINYIIPKEGGTIWSDNMVILAKSPNSEIAHKFMNFILDSSTAAEVSNDIGYGTPVFTAMPNIELKDNELIYPPKAIRDRLELLSDLGAGTDAFNRTWANIRSK